MNPASTSQTLWQCPKCGRRFLRRGQRHSCNVYSIEKHFEGKRASKLLYQQLKKAVRKNVGPFQAESLACCIHWLNPTTFAAIKIFKEKIQVDFSLHGMIKSKRIARVVQISARSCLYVVDVKKEEDIDEELMNWLREAYAKKTVHAKQPETTIVHR